METVIGTETQASARWSIRGRADVEAARRYAGDVARANGFGAADAAEVILIASELAENLLAHSAGGALAISVPPGMPAAVRVEATDAGPGIADISAALTEGYSTKSGLGQGLPLVQRLSDSLTISSSPSGTRIVVIRSAR